MKTTKNVSRRSFIVGTGAVTAASIISSKMAFAGKPQDAKGNPETKDYSRSQNITPPQAIPEGYNILFIVSDQERYFEKYPFPVPGRERLYATGTKFTNHHICSSVCTPSRSVLYTGLHMPQTGMFDNPGFPWMPNSMDPKLGTLGHIMQEIGYYPAYKGKWHLNTFMEDPVEKNPDGTTELGDIPREKLHAIMEEYGFHDYTGVGDVIGHSQGGYLYDELTSSQAINWLRGKGRTKQDKNEPWMLAVNLVNPHDVMYIDTDEGGEKNQWKGPLIAGSNSSTPNQAPKNTLYKNGWPDVPLAKSRHQSFNEPGRPHAHEEYQMCNGVLVGTIADQDRRWRKLQDYYFNCIRDNDTQLMRILNELDALDLSKNTIIVYTADHGELCGAHQMSGKGTCTYKEQVNVPLTIVHPAFPGGKACSALTCHVDIVPTLVGLTGKENLNKSQTLASRKGYDLSDLLFSPDKKPVNAVRDSILYYYDMLMYSDATYIGNMFKVIRDKALTKAEKQRLFNTFTPNLDKRGGVRMVCDGKYKFTRYFSLRQHHTPTTIDFLLKYNDIELYDTVNDPDEMTNLAHDENYRGVMMQLNSQLNAQFASEIGIKDDGHYIPALHGLTWNLDPEHVERYLRD